MASCFHRETWGDRWRQRRSAFAGMTRRRQFPELTTASNDSSLIVSSQARAALIRLQSQWSDALERELTNSSNCIAAWKPASVLYAWGTNAGWIGSQLIARAAQTKDSERFDLLNFLCETELEPAVAWPLVLLAIESKWVLR